MDKNKVKFGLRNVHYAKLAIGEDGTPSYAPPRKWPGAVSLGLDAEGDATPFYADDTAYYVSVANNGYSGDFESAMVPDDFNEDIMGNVKDAGGVQIEDASVQPEAFALLFEFEGDKNAIRHVLYNCKMTRPSVESETTEDSKEPKTETGTVTVSPLTLPNPVTIGTGETAKTINTIVKGKTTADTTTDIYQGWYNAVYLPGVQNPKITVQPSGVSIATGATATFFVTAESDDGGALSYQWQKSTGSGAFADVSGATSASYQTAAAEAGDDGTLYRCLVTNTRGGLSVTNATVAAMLTVTATG